MTADGLTATAAATAAAGLGIAAYLTYVHYAGIEPVCSTGGCERVQSSDYAELAGLPVALLGLVGYAGILAALRVRGEPGRGAAAFLSLVGFGYSAYLTWLELARIDAVCQWCVASAVCMTALAVLTTARWLRG
jgi:uncharacterized membrane protein